MIKKVFIVILSFFVLVGCKTKQVEKKQDIYKKKQDKTIVKDSVLSQKAQNQNKSFSIEKSENLTFEIEKEPNEDMYFHRIRDGDSEKIVVKGGKVKIKVQKVNKENIKDSLTLAKQEVNKTTTNSIKEDNTIKRHQKSKNIKSTGFGMGFYIVGFLIILLMFISWRYKLFR